MFPWLRRGQRDGFLLARQRVLSDGGKLHVVEKVPSLIFLHFADFIVLEVETYPNLSFLRNVLGLGGKEWIYFPPELIKIPNEDSHSLGFPLTCWLGTDGR